MVKKGRDKTARGVWYCGRPVMGRLVLKLLSIANGIARAISMLGVGSCGEIVMVTAIVVPLMVKIVHCAANYPNNRLSHHSFYHLAHLHPYIPSATLCLFIYPPRSSRRVDDGQMC
jgi:hypothetical protein